MWGEVLLSVCLWFICMRCKHARGVYDAGTTLDVKIDLQRAVSQTGPKYIGLTVDSSFILTNFSSVDLSSRRLQTVTKALSPSYVRVGGTLADRLLFDATATGVVNETVIGADIWQKINRLAQMAGWDLIFDVNVLVRKDGHWDPSNARQLLQYSQDRGYNIPCFQLGNEPHALFNFYHTTVPPESLALDYQLFKSFLAEFPLYQNSCITGPELSRIANPSVREYLYKFLQAGGGRSLSAVGVHHYYCDPAFEINLNFFTNVTVLNSLKAELDEVLSISHKFAPQLPVWFTETASIYINCAGESDLLTSYADGFLWLDKLGMSALYGIQHLNREQFWVQLIPFAEDVNPLPDYYMTLLYKRLVEGPVFRVLTSTDTVRVYAHCANQKSYPGGAVTVYVVNLEAENVTLTFSQFTGQPLHVYMLSPGDQNGLSSRTVALNGKQLAMDGDDLPPFPPKSVSGPITMAAKTFGFIVIPDANVTMCRQ